MKTIGTARNRCPFCNEYVEFGLGGNDTLTWTCVCGADETTGPEGPILEDDGDEEREGGK